MQAGNTYSLEPIHKVAILYFMIQVFPVNMLVLRYTPEDTLFIEDLKSRNGVLINSSPIESKQELSPNTIVTLGTTSFVVYDREGEMQTIISPLLPSIVKVLQQEARLSTVETPTEPVQSKPAPEATPPVAVPTPNLQDIWALYCLNSNYWTFCTCWNWNNGVISKSQYRANSRKCR